MHTAAAECILIHGIEASHHWVKQVGVNRTLRTICKKPPAHNRTLNVTKYFSILKVDGGHMQNTVAQMLVILIHIAAVIHVQQCH